ncbi:MAG TPA: SDR family NAD(P)-dependent oxidoreductase [Candidatus Lumbricidophila sp.]|nr:SDR family NAD(P)-dependent oxidoreductase [Candidatus Lumbricidophila sp.]
MSVWVEPLSPVEGRSYLVTGGSRGLGFFTAARLAAAGAHVTITGRDESRLQAAARAIRNVPTQVAVRPGAVTTLVMDQSSLGAVATGASQLMDTAPLDGLILNAGMVHTPRKRVESVDGNELVLATNVLGHIALVGHLVRHLADNARIVSLGSLSTRLVPVRADDLQLTGWYHWGQAYAQSKILTEAFGFELHRRLTAAGSDVSSIVAHPGYSLSGRTPRVAGVNEPSRTARFVDSLQAAITQGKHLGAEPIVHAAVGADVESGDYWGPSGLVKGRPVRQRPTSQVLNPALGAAIWALGEAAAGFEISVD